MLRRVLVVVLGASALALAFAAAAETSQGPVVPNPKVSIAVAPFERVGRVGPDVPDVAMMLARRLSTLGIERVVSPRDLGAPAEAEPDAATLVGWASGSGVQTIVVGRTTALGSRLSIDARLHTGADGAAVGNRFFAEAARARDLPLAVQDLADQILERTGDVDATTAVARSQPSTPSAAAGAPAGAASPPADVASAPAPPRAGFSDDAPISIRSDVLDVYDRGGQKRFVFSGNVRALQGDLEIYSRRLEAFYPPGGSQPHKIVARGDVKLKQAGRLADCDEATFYRNDDRIVCTGEIAEVEQGCDIVRGREIIFHTRSEQLKVNGAADVRINADGSCTPEVEG